MKDDMQQKRQTWPFRLGCTSYVYPADLLPNAEKCAPLFDDIEVVLFESVDSSNMPSAEVIHGLAKLSREHGNTYTIHFPIDKKAASPDSVERSRYCEQMAKILTLVEPLDPYAYILHLEGIGPDADARARSRWLMDAAESCAFLSAHMGRDAHKVAVENLACPYEWHLPLTKEYGFSLCLDIGHLWRYGADWSAACEALLPQTRVIHLHGWDGTNDHESLKKMDKGILSTLCKHYLKEYDHVLTLELFNESDTFESLRLMEELW
ncbi:MAG: cobamide remodeling phosphodiesterase CbiR, partial [Fibrobacterota bacterium]